MTSNDPAQPPSTPEDEGIPDYANDDSTAYDDTDRPRFRDSPPPLPGDRPQALDEYGLTADEQRHHESLEAHLAREEPDTTVDHGDREPGRAVGRLVEPDQGVRSDTEASLLAGETGVAADEGLSAEEAAVHEQSEEEEEETEADEEYRAEPW